MPTEPAPAKRAYLWVNDVPNEMIAEHGHVYRAEDFKSPRPGVTVSFVAVNGRYQRVEFDPWTGEVSVREMPPGADSGAEFSAR